MRSCRRLYLRCAPTVDRQMQSRAFDPTCHRAFTTALNSRRYREHLRATAAALMRRPADDDSGDEGTTVRDLMVVNLGPAWVDDSLYQLFGR